MCASGYRLGKGGETALIINERQMCLTVGSVLVSYIAQVITVEYSLPRAQCSTTTISAMLGLEIFSLLRYMYVAKDTGQ